MSVALSRIEEKIDKLIERSNEEFSLDDELKRSITVDIVRHILHELEYGRGTTTGKDSASIEMKIMYTVWKNIPQKTRDVIIQEWIDWGVSAIKSRGL